MASNAAAGSNDTTDSNADSIALSDIEFSDVDFDHAVESSDDSDSDSEFEDEVERISTTAEEEVASQRPYVREATFDSFSAAYRAMVDRSDDIYTYETRYESDRLIYRCRSHNNCGVRFKIKTVIEPEAPTQYYLERTGSRGSQPTTVTRRGIHPQLLDEVDALLNMGWGAKQLRSMLNHRCRNESRFLCMRVCATREKFMAVDDPNDRRMDEMIVLDTFIFDGQAPDGGTSFGVVVTTQRVFRNVTRSVRDKDETLVCATDGTYKLHFGGWTVVDCGSVGLTWSKSKTESKAGYAKMFEVVCERALSFLRVEVQVAFGSRDHSEAIASAFCEVTHFSEGPVPPEMMTKAELLVATQRNYKLVYKGRGRLRRLCAVVFNVTKHIVGGQGMLGADVDNERASKFLKSLDGRFPRRITYLELEFELLSLHRVMVKQQDYPPPFELLPIWSHETVERLRNF
ncbi:hypothetical protein AM587_10002325 [Phytophthora nicotianae]|uniref:Uncharacterized protein n=1 Tax=Phytophthora nicotianae TaxID=4792 RepID=A0A0W8C389_PHYNI|nr:hypothetical protein AM587_10002325 [Phytophthora nicotianae]